MFNTKSFFEKACFLSISLALTGCGQALHNYSYHEFDSPLMGYETIYVARTNVIIGPDKRNRDRVVSGVEKGLVALTAIATSGGVLLPSVQLSKSPIYPGRGKFSNHRFELLIGTGGVLSPVKEFSERGEPVAFDVELGNRDLQLVAANFFQYGHVSRYLDNIGVLNPNGLFIDGYTSVIAIGYQHGDKGFGLRVIGLEHAEVQYCRGLANRGLKQSQISKLVAERSQKVTLKGGSEPYSLAYSFACNTVMWAKPLNEQVSRKLAYRFNTKGTNVSRLWDKVRVANPDIGDKNIYSAFSEPPLLLEVANGLRAK